MEVWPFHFYDEWLSLRYYHPVKLMVSSPNNTNFVIIAPLPLYGYENISRKSALHSLQHIFPKKVVMLELYNNFLECYEK